MNLLKQLGITLLLALGWAITYAAPQEVEGPAPSDLVGHYFLKGMREMVGRISLSSDGRFALAIAYGAVDMAVEGRWTVKESTLELTADVPPPPTLSLGAKRGEFIEKQEKPMLLDVQVTSPKLGLTWSSMEITAEFSNGLSRSGTTGQIGMVSFLDRDDEPWRGATIRRVSVAYPRGNVAPVWFDVDAATTKALIVHFDPGSLVQTPFQSVDFRVRRGPDGRIALVQDDAEQPAPVFEKQ